jgi:hypothetical protein
MPGINRQWVRRRLRANDRFDGLAIVETAGRSLAATPAAGHRDTPNSANGQNSKPDGDRQRGLGLRWRGSCGWRLTRSRIGFNRGSRRPEESDSC